MSGKIELIVRKSIAKKKSLKYYPGWIWKITGENEKEVLIMPSWNDLEIALRKTIIHEKKVDIVTGRNPDTQRYQKFLKKMAIEFQELQTTITELAVIEDIYKDCLK